MPNGIDPITGLSTEATDKLLNIASQKAYKDKDPLNNFVDQQSIEGIDLTKRINKYLPDAQFAPANMSMDDLMTFKGMTQGTIKQGFNSIMGGIGGGLARGIENLFLIPDALGLTPGLEDYDKNPMAKVFGDLAASIDEAMPIYDIKGQFDSGDFFGGVKSIIDSGISFGIPGGVISKGVGGLTRISQATKLGQLLSKATPNRIKNLVGAAEGSKTFNALVQAGGAGVISNQLEGTVMGIEVYDKVLKDLMAKGISESKAKSIAKEKADDMVSMNRMLLVSNIFQMHGINKAMAGTRNILDAPGLFNAYKKGLTQKSSDNLILQGLSEGAEEMFQSTIQQSLEKMALQDAKLVDENKSLWQMMGENLLNSQTLHEGLLGFFGGVLQRPITQAIANAGKNEEVTKRYNEQLNFIDYSNKLAEANLETFAKYDNFRDHAKKHGNLDLETAINNAQFVDLATAAFDLGTTGQLEASLRDIAQNPETSQEEKANAEQLVDKLIELEKEYIKNPNPVAFKMHQHNKVLNEVAENKRKTIDAKLNNFKREANSIAKEYKIVTDVYGVTSESTLDKHIEINDNGTVKFDDYIKKENPYNQQVVDDYLNDIESTPSYTEYEQEADSYQEVLTAYKEGLSKAKIVNSEEYKIEKKKEEEVKEEVNKPDITKKEVKQLENQYPNQDLSSTKEKVEQANIDKLNSQKQALEDTSNDYVQPVEEFLAKQSTPTKKSKDSITLKTEVKELEKQVNNTEFTTVVDTSGKTVEGDIIIDGTNKLAYQAGEFNKIESKNRIKREDILDENGRVKLNSNYIDLLHPDKYLPGENLTLKVVENPNDIEVYSGKEKITFKDWVNKNPTEDPNSKIPIEVLDSKGARIAFIHDSDWINSDNVAGDINSQKAKIKAIRKAIVTEGPIKTKITSKTFGKFLKTKIDTLAKNTPNSEIAIVARGVLTQKVDKTPMKIEVINQPKQDGQLVNLLRVQGNKHIITPVIQSRLNKDLAESVYEAIGVYVTQNEELAKEASDYNLLEIDGLREYINSITPVKSTGGYRIDLDKIQESTYKFINNSKVNNQVVGRPYILIESGNIIMGVEGASKDDIIYLTKGSTKLSEFKDRIVKDMQNAYTNASLDSFEKNLPILKEGKVEQKIPYGNFIRETATTNIYGINIGDVDIYTTQPVIRYDESFIKTTPKVEKEVVSKTTKKPLTKKKSKVLSKLNKFKKHNSHLVKKKVTQPKLNISKAASSQYQNILGGKTDKFIISKPEKSIGIVFSETKDFIKMNDSEWDTYANLLADKKAGKIDKYKFNESKLEIVKKVISRVFNKSLSPRTFTEVESNTLSEKIAQEQNLYKGLTPLQAGQTIQEIISLVSTEASVKGTVNFNEFIKNYKNQLVEETIELQEYLGDEDFDQDVLVTLIELYIATTNNIDNLAKMAKEELSNDDRYKLETDIEVGERYDITVFEVDSKAGVSKSLKRMMSSVVDTIESTNEDGDLELEAVTNYLGRDQFLTFDYVYNTLASVLVQAPHNIEGIKSRLLEYEAALPWLSQISNELDRVDEQLRNQFIARMPMSKLDMNHVFTKDNKIQVGTTNTNDRAERTLTNWKINIKQSPLFIPVEGDYKVDTDYYNAVINRFDSVQGDTISSDTLSNFLELFGIELSEKTLNHIINKGFYYGGSKQSANNILSKKKGDSLGKILITKLTNLESNELTLSEDNILNESIVKSLSKLDTKYNTELFNTPNTFRTGEKQIYSFIQHTMSSDRLKYLRSGAIVEDLKSSSFTKDSVYLDYFDVNHPNYNDNFSKEFREKFNLYDSDLTALKVERQNSSEFTKMAEAEIELARMGYFRNNNTKFTSGKRFAKYVMPTMSDKKRVLILEALAYKYKDPAELLLNRAVMPEINRILEHVETNIKGYNSGAKMINFFPHLNSLEISVKNEKLKLYQLLTTHKELAQTEEILELIKQPIKSSLEEYINSQVELKFNKYKKLNFIGKDKFFSTDKSAQKEIEEFVVNNMVNTAEAFQMFIGDPAMFYKSKQFQKVNTREGFNKKSPRAEALEYYTEEDWVSEVENSFVNVGKRLAMLIAPGHKLANSENNKYVQIMLEDRETKSLVLDYLNTMFDASDYNFIEGADAQEFTTWQEHLYVMEKTGDIAPILDLKGVEITKEDIQNGKSLFSSGKSLESLTKQEKDLMKKLMQPMKPVVTGQYKDGKVMRITYIKSSSFPLIPQLTKGLEIDKLKDMMEEVQAKTINKQTGSLGGTVRASFQTANKVGAILKPIDIWNEDGTIKKIDAQEILDSSSVILPRTNFRIQQEVPFKSGKKQKQDVVNVGSQERKLMFSNLFGQKGFELNGKEFTAEELYSRYNEIYDELFKGQRSKLLQELNIDENSSLPIHKQIKVEKIAEILVKEAESRNYPIGDVKGLEIVDGKFIMPLWLHQSSDKYESLLNSIISNRILSFKFPGYSYILGTEEGFRTLEESDDLSNVVFTDAWEGKLKPARFIVKKTGQTIDKPIESYKKSDIEFKPSQALAPVKLRNAKGELLDLLATDSNGNYKYVIKKDNKYSLNTKVFDKEMLAQFGFRIPTSGLMSTASLEIVGFLPAQSGDLLLTTRDFTVQMGSDFDVDKLTTYMYAHKEEGGKIVRDDEGDKGLVNEIIDIHLSILSHKSSFTQAQIHRPLSFAFAGDVANEITAKRKSTSYKFTPLSDEYQSSKLASGSAGKDGTGVYSLDVVFHANLQALVAQGDSVKIVDVETGSAYSLNIAGNQSHTDLGMDQTVKPSNEVLIEEYTKAFGENPNDIKEESNQFRFISDVLAEAQNYSVDNANEEIMGQLNDNGTTFNARKVFNELGLDKTRSYIRMDSGEYKRMSIVNMFMSQTILFDHFVPLIADKTSSLAAYDSNVKATVKQEIMDSLPKELVAQYIERADYNSIIANQLSEQELYDMLGKSLEEMSKREKTYQLAILEKFLEVDEIGAAINSVQTTISTDSKKLGKSTAENVDKINKVLTLKDKMVNNKLMLVNTEKLIGTYSDKAIDGGVKINEGFYIKPETVNGFASIYGLLLSGELYKDYIPFSSNQFNQVLGKLSIALDKELSIKDKQLFMKAVKSYSYNSQSTLQSTQDINKSREKIFIDSKSNTSLAKYIKEIDTDVLKRFAIVNSLTFDINTNGRPSLIKWNNVARNEYENQHYLSFLDMFQDETSLPDYNGETMNIQKLAQYLVEYSYLEGGIQEAIQFIRHLPTEYLEAIGIAKEFRNRDFNNLMMYGTNSFKMQDKNHMPNVVKQFIQHNPAKVFQVEGLNGEFITMSNISSKISTENLPHFIGSYSQEKAEKGLKNSGFYLYEYDASKNGYLRIPVLGAFGMKEYNSDILDIQTSLVQKNPGSNFSKKAIQKELTKPTKVEKAKTLSTKRVLESIKNSKINKGYSALAVELQGIDTPIKIVDDNTFNGMYNNGVIYISKDFISKVKQGIYSEEKYQAVMLEEIVHAATEEKLPLALDTKGLKPQIKRLIRLYQKAKEKITEIYGEDAIKEVIDKIESEKALTDVEFGHIYGGVNLKEFIAQLLVNRNFQQLLNEVTISKTPGSETYWSKMKKLFTEVVKQILNIQSKEDSLTSLAIADIIDLIRGNDTKVLNSTELAERSYLLPNGKTIIFNNQQWDALENIKNWSNSKETDFILAGYAGTGKTTIVKKFIDNYKGYVGVTAPTHKAKKVIAETTEKQAFTIQALLGLKPNTDIENFNPNKAVFAKRDEAKIKQYDLIVLDEASMLNKALFELLRKEAKKNGVKILYMGDPAQIPPVGEKESLVFSQIKSKSQLTKVERTADGNPLMPIFDSIRDNLDKSTDSYSRFTNLNDKGEGVEFIESGKEFRDKVTEFYDSNDYKQDSDFMKTIAWTNNEVATWNTIIRDKLYGYPEDLIVPGELLMAYRSESISYDPVIENSAEYIIFDVDKHEVQIGDRTLKGYLVNFEGDSDKKYTKKFIVDTRDKGTKAAFYRINNEMIDKANKAKGRNKGQLWGEYYRFRASNLLFQDIRDAKGKLLIAKSLDYGYAITAHKSQGSTYSNVAILEGNINKNSKVRERNQIKYVAFSRAKNKALVLKGDKPSKIEKIQTGFEETYIDEGFVPPTKEELAEMTSIKTLSPIVISEFKVGLTKEQRKLFTKLRKEGIIKTKC